MGVVLEALLLLTIHIPPNNEFILAAHELEAIVSCVFIRSLFIKIIVLSVNVQGY